MDVEGEIAYGSTREDAFGVEGGLKLSSVRLLHARARTPATLYFIFNMCTYDTFMGDQ